MTKNDVSELFTTILLLLIIIGISLVFCSFISKYTCHKKAEALGYKCSWHFGSGCVLEKPNGKKVLLEQLREFE